MGYETKLARSFSRAEPQKLGFAAAAVCFVISLMLFSVLDPYMMNPLMSLLQQRQQQKGSSSPGLSTDAEAPPAKSTNDISTNLHANFSSPDSELLPNFEELAGSQNESHSVESHSVESPKSNHCTTGGHSVESHDNSTTLAQSIKHDATDSSGGGDKVSVERTPICNVSDPRTDVCDVIGDIRIHGGVTPSVIYNYDYDEPPLVAKSLIRVNESWRIRPYARKGDGTAMGHVKEVLVARSSPSATNHTTCTANHTSNATAAVVFSVAGYTGNLFHDFTDVIVPLFLTSREFDGRVQFLVTDSNLWWVAKYRTLLRGLSRYEIVDLDRDNNDALHCFRHVVVGLRCHNELTIVPSRSPNGYSMLDFTSFLRATYSLRRDSVANEHQQRQIPQQQLTPRKRRLLIISRKRTRTFLNTDEIIRTAESVGFEVVVLEPTISSSVATLATTVNSCDVMVGVHGAGLTNIVFLPESAVVLQVVPWGGLEWIGRLDFGRPAADMGLRYLEYRIEPEESSLMEKYPRDHPVFRDPFSFHRKGWDAVREAFLVRQDVRVDVGRFRPVLVEALNLLSR